jgi:hypothetical protein
MTDLDLQAALVRELKQLQKYKSLKLLDGSEWKDFHIYTQDKPYKDDADYDEQEDYVIVLIDDEDADSDGWWTVQIQFIISICLYEEQHQGNLIIANLMNQIYLHLKSKGIIDGCYEMENKAHKRFNQECYPNYYECALITYWKLPPVRMTGLEEFI